MPNLPLTVSSETHDHPFRANDPIIEREDVMWAARRFILLYGERATEVAKGEELRLDMAGKLHVAAMFSQVAGECRRLLEKSEYLRNEEQAAQADYLQ